jgi:serine-type D-Ala-D-Ala carboxypeptidase (penicillin-binding protein 5/6)
MRDRIVVARLLRTKVLGRIVAGIVTLAVLGAVPTGATALAEESRAPAPDARAAIVVDAESGTVLFERNAGAELAPASLTKMVTALVAVERAPLDRLVRTSHPYAVTPIVIGLEPGDTLSLEATLYGLMLNSGNDAALAIAETVADGSSERFVGWMNELAGRLGLKNTRFKNPHGLGQDGHVSSAYDMAIIGRAVMRQPTLARIVGQRRHVVEGPPRWVFNTSNPLLGVYAGLDGIKTGYDDQAGRCLVATAIRGDRRAIAVVMNSSRYGDEAASLLDHAFDDAAWGPVKLAETSDRPGKDRISMLRADMIAAPDSAPGSIARAGRLLLSAGSGTRS